MKEKASVSFASPSFQIFEKADDIQKLLESFDYKDDDWFKEVYPSLKEGAKFASIIPLYITTSRNRRSYTEKAVKTFTKLVVGVEGYLGHEYSWNSTPYRTPVGRFVAANFEKVNIKGKMVDGCKTLFYFSSIEEAQKLFTTIKEGIAGNVSLDGYIVSKYDEKSTIYTVEEFVEVNSVDFVNNRTESVVGAGVSDIVKESYSKLEKPSSDGTEQRNKEKQMTVTISSLKESAEGREVISLISQEAVAPLNERIKTLESEGGDLKSKIVDLEKKNTEASKKIDSLKSALGSKTLEAYLGTVIDFARAEESTAAQSESRDPDYTLIEMSKSNIDVKSIERFIVADDSEDFAKSKEAVKSEFNKVLKNFKSIKESLKEKNQGSRSSESGVMNNGSNKSGSGSLSVKDVFGPVFADKKSK